MINSCIACAGSSATEPVTINPTLIPRLGGPPSIGTPGQWNHLTVDRFREIRLIGPVDVCNMPHPNREYSGIEGSFTTRYRLLGVAHEDRDLHVCHR
jgi:hypothetical protein